MYQCKTRIFLRIPVEFHSCARTKDWINISQRLSKHAFSGFHLFLSILIHANRKIRMQKQFHSQKWQRTIPETSVKPTSFITPSLSLISGERSMPSFVLKSYFCYI